MIKWTFSFKMGLLSPLLRVEKFSDSLEKSTKLKIKENFRPRSGRTPYSALIRVLASKIVQQAVTIAQRLFAIVTTIRTIRILSNAKNSSSICTTHV